jgi:hypothetical protein
MRSRRDPVRAQRPSQSRRQRARAAWPTTPTDHRLVVTKESARFDGRIPVLQLAPVVFHHAEPRAHATACGFALAASRPHAGAHFATTGGVSASRGTIWRHFPGALRTHAQQLGPLASPW